MSRIIYETHKMENSHLPFIFHTTTVTRREQSPNWHNNIEFLCFVNGEGTLHIDGRQLDVGTGDIAVINAQHLHSISSKTSVMFYCLIVDDSYCLDNGINISDIEFSEFISDAVLFESFCKVARGFDSIKQGNNDVTAVPYLRYNILGILLYLCDNYLSLDGKNRTEDDRIYNTVKEVIRYLRKASGKVSLDEIADHVQMSKFHMSREFKRITGTTIFEYLNIFRCENAKRMISNGANISEAAFTSGFDNLSYFSRTFKRFMGVLPSEYQRNKKK